ncbi:MAG: tetratricopeptide repeat protein [Myxococcales bacterium]|nr:tetratricopeptide repeat protein [Myxococcales bacterium]MBL0192664.1 tetratricopeptide repeat protein [Myxococcales bacterium]HQY62125.1 tetratricopeptide repeat protein [Polyangiaceae bacterium]
MPQERPAPVDHARWEAVDEAVELLHEERFREALGLLRDVVKADAKNAYAYFFMGQALYECGEVAASRDAYRACVLVAPEHLGAHVALCHVLRQLGEVKEAIAEGNRALDQAPGDADALYALGMAHLARGDDAAARRHLEAFLEAGAEFEVATEVRAVLADMATGKRK